MRHTNRLLTGALAAALTVSGLTLSLAKPGDVKSGVPVGGIVSAFTPHHVSGADKQTDTCPVCKYPTNPAVQVWVNTDDPKNVAQIADTLEKVAKANTGKKFKAFVVFINPNKEAGAKLGRQLEGIAARENLQNVALVYLPGPTDEAVKDYEINTDAKVKNTVFVYKSRKVNAKFVNLVADKKGVDTLETAIKGVLK